MAKIYYLPNFISPNSAIHQTFPLYGTVLLGTKFSMIKVIFKVQSIYRIVSNFFGK